MYQSINVLLPQGFKALRFYTLTGKEKLSSHFDFEVKLLAPPESIADTLLGLPLTIAIPTGKILHPLRYLNGNITSVNMLPVENKNQRYSLYTLRVESDLWRLRHDRDQRIFQHQSVVEIIVAVLRSHGIRPELKLSSEYRLWEFCVQYQESSLAFISRLMELEGIYYFFRHEADRHVMVLADHPSALQVFSGYATIPFHTTPHGGITTEQGIGTWLLHERATPGVYTTSDYDFRQPYADLSQRHYNSAAPEPGEIDYYDWPGHYTSHHQGETCARIRQQAWQVRHRQVKATGNAIGITPGHYFHLLQPQSSTVDNSYLVISAEYDLRESGYASGGDEGYRYIGFSAIPLNVPFRSEQKTPWPRTCGPQTARVMGPKGHAIWTDKFGRVKVRFHWDRSGKQDDTCSGWIRVSTNWAGQGFGGIQIPRIEDEVIVDFINGDPDRPIITGRVYNEAKMPPWALPAAATQMGFMSRSKGCMAGNANILMFDDKPDEELVVIQAQRDLDLLTKRDVSQSTGGNFYHQITGDSQSNVGGSQQLAVEGNDVRFCRKRKTDTAVEEFIIASGSQLRLECGESIIELNSDGTVNITGKVFNLLAHNEANINTTTGPLSLNQGDQFSDLGRKVALMTEGSVSSSSLYEEKNRTQSNKKDDGVEEQVEKHSIIETEYDITFDEMLEKQVGLKHFPTKHAGNKGFVQASRDEVRMHLHPKNNFGDIQKFQFLKLSSPSGVSHEQMQDFLKNKGVLEGKAKLYLEIAERYNINEAYLAAHSALETGNGTSKLATGYNLEGVTVYNMYGIGAIDGSALISGARFALKKGWTTPEKAIEGGAKWISDKYVGNRGQDTLYKMRWNPDSPGTHQYATDINWALAQTSKIAKMMNEFPDANLIFDVPKYKE